MFDLVWFRALIISPLRHNTVVCPVTSVSRHPRMSFHRENFPTREHTSILVVKKIQICLIFSRITVAKDACELAPTRTLSDSCTLFLPTNVKNMTSKFLVFASEC